MLRRRLFAMLSIVVLLAVFAPSASAAEDPRQLEAEFQVVLNGNDGQPRWQYTIRVLATEWAPEINAPYAELNVRTYDVIEGTEQPECFAYGIPDHISIQRNDFRLKTALVEAPDGRCGPDDDIRVALTWTPTGFGDPRPAQVTGVVDPPLDPALYAAPWSHPEKFNRSYGGQGWIGHINTDGRWNYLCEQAGTC